MSGLPRIVFVAGAARSGSTLLGEMLGQQPGVLNAGELSLIWRDAARGGQCACGEPIVTCSLWGEALSRVMGGRGPWTPRLEALASTRAGLAHTSRPAALARMLRDPSRATWSPAERELIDATAGLHAAAGELAGAHVIVDTSKTMSALAFDRLVTGRLDTVHLVREPRAVVASTMASRGVRRRNVDGLPPGAGLLKSTVQWTWMNSTAALASGWFSSGTTARLAYEDLVATPAPSARMLCSTLELPFDEGTLEGGELRFVTASHVAVGNPGRGGAVGDRKAVAPDRRWLDQLSRGQSTVVHAATAPVAALLRRGRLIPTDPSDR